MLYASFDQVVRCTYGVVVASHTSFAVVVAAAFAVVAASAMVAALAPVVAAFGRKLGIHHRCSAAMGDTDALSTGLLYFNHFFLTWCTVAATAMNLCKNCGGSAAATSAAAASTAVTTTVTTDVTATAALVTAALATAMFMATAASVTALFMAATLSTASVSFSTFSTLTTFSTLGASTANDCTFDISGSEQASPDCSLSSFLQVPK